MGRIKQKQILYITVAASILSIIVSVVTLIGPLAILDSDAIIFLSPSVGDTYDLDSTVTVSIIFSPHLTGVDAPQATGYSLLAKVGDTILAQEEATGVLYTTAFTLTRYFTASEVGEVIIRATMIVDGTDYYNEIFISVISPDTVTVTIDDTLTTTSDSTTPFSIITIFISLIVLIYINKKRVEKNGKL